MKYERKKTVYEKLTDIREKALKRRDELRDKRHRGVVLTYDELYETRNILEEVLVEIELIGRLKAIDGESNWTK